MGGGGEERRGEHQGGGWDLQISSWKGGGRLLYIFAFHLTCFFMPEFFVSFH